VSHTLHTLLLFISLNWAVHGPSFRKHLTLFNINLSFFNNWSKSTFSIIDKNFLISSWMFEWWSSFLFTTFAASSSSVAENDTPTTVMSTNTKTKSFETILLLFGHKLNRLYVYWRKWNSDEVETHCKIAVSWLGCIYTHLLCTCQIYEVIIWFGRWWKITLIKILPSASSFTKNDKDLVTLSTQITILYRYIIYNIHIFKHESH